MIPNRAALAGAPPRATGRPRERHFGPLSVIRDRIADLRQGFLLGVGFVRFILAPVVRYWLGRPVSTSEVGARLRAFLDHGGLIYRKLGQYLAMRSDLLPPSICAELDLLFEGVSQMPFREVAHVLREEFGRPWEECFASLEPHPIGSASVAQVHRATALDGELLAVKVQRAGIRTEFAAGVRVFRHLASFCDLFRLTGTLYLRDLFDEFARFTGQELDFDIEGRTADRLRQAMSPHGHVPYVRWDLTTSRVLSMEFVEGESFLTLCRLAEHGANAEIARILNGCDLDEVVYNLADECFKQLFVTGFFHGDPHPGNAILRPDGVFVFLDCGISGELSAEQRADLSGFVESLALGRFTESAIYYTRLCELSAATDIDAWTYDVASALASWHAGIRDSSSPVENRHMGRLQANIAIAMRRHKVRNRPNQLLVWRALVLLDTTTLRLPVNFDLLQALGAFFRGRHGNPLQVATRSLSGLVSEAPALGQTVASLRALLAGSRSFNPGVIRYDTSTGGLARAATNRLMCAVAGMFFGAVAAACGGGNLTSVIALASVLFLLLAARG